MSISEEDIVNERLIDELESRQLLYNKNLKVCSYAWEELSQYLFRAWGQLSAKEKTDAVIQQPHSVDASVRRHLRRTSFSNIVIQLQLDMKWSKTIILGLSCGLVLLGSLVGWVIFPPLLKRQLKKEMSLNRGNDVRELWEKLPFPLDFRIWLFNFTNPEEVQRGGKPALQEVGPYYFEVWKEKVDVEDNEAEDTITYRKLDTFIFRQDKSGYLTGEEMICQPNIVLVSVGVITARTKPAMMKPVGKAINAIWKDPKDVFHCVRALDVIVRGTEFDCSHKDFAPKAVCKVLDTEPNLVHLPNKRYRFSILEKRNATRSSYTITVMRGTSNVMDVGKVIAVDGQAQLKNMWRDDCNRFEGTDGTVFPPFLTPIDRIVVYNTDLWRSFRLTYHNKTSYQRISTNRYVTDFGDLANDPELNCLCDTSDTCPRKGIFDNFRTGNGPMQLTLPHFLGCDPSLLQENDGLDPDFENHGLYIDFEPISGTPLEAKQRIQFNLPLTKIDELELFKDLPDTIVPVFWVEEVLALNKTYVKMLYNQLFIPIKIVNIIQWVLIVFGIVGWVTWMVWYYEDWMENKMVAEAKKQDGVKAEKLDITVANLLNGRLES